ncbi:hypothetical protein [Stakelama marina]|uniref:Uncharacterized protein n=1 Tax=Stakelama marina TaxID=2826939 RepID=A0A8T4IN90_9SPHN|nr:hypothetical protein [Stakelama marina]MBR0553799.1 hypothetical protein [Stakelama marina]
MTAYTFRPSLKAPLTATAPLAAALFAGAAIGLAPVAMLERVVMESGLPAVLPAAAPPLGVTARVAMALIAAGLAAMAVWAVVSLLALRRLGASQPAIADEPYEMVPQVRRADAHPDAPPRAPLRATVDLGVPSEPARDIEAVEDDAIVEETPVVLRKPPVERDLPNDLDQPLSSYDPDALPDTPLAPQQPVRPLHRPAPQPLEAGERLETFELTPPVRRASEPQRIEEDDIPITGPETEATVHALLERLERGVERRARRRVEKPATAAAGLNGTLDQLRKLAVNG